MRFRIYNKKEKKYISENIGQYYINHKGKLFFIYAGDGEHNELHKELAPDIYIVEYSTGKKDKRDTEIYAGDIVCDPDGYHYQVEWDSEDAMFCLNEISGCDSVDFKCARSEDFEVIITIHDGGENERN